MADIKLRLTTKAACSVARIDRDRFNEHVAAGNFKCAPATIPGRSRLFDPDDMLALWLFRELMGKGTDAKIAGEIACEISRTARQYPEEPTITYLETYMSGVSGFTAHGRAFPAREVPAAVDLAEVLVSGSDVDEARTFNIAKRRKLIAHYTEEERNIIGADD